MNRAAEDGSAREGESQVAGRIVEALTEKKGGHLESCHAPHEQILSIAL